MVNPGPYDSPSQARDAAAQAYQGRAYVPLRHSALSLLMAAVEETGTPVGAYDRDLMTWLATAEPDIAVVVAGLIRRAHQAGGGGHPVSTSPAAHLARLKITYGPRWHISTSIPGTGPRTITAIETGTGRRIQARNEPEMEAKLMHAGRRPQPPAGQGMYPFRPIA